VPRVSPHTRLSDRDDQHLHCPRPYEQVSDGRNAVRDAPPRPLSTGAFVVSVAGPGELMEDLDEHTRGNRRNQQTRSDQQDQESQRANDPRPCMASSQL